MSKAAPEEPPAAASDLEKGFGSFQPAGGGGAQGSSKSDGRRIFLKREAPGNEDLKAAKSLRTEPLEAPPVFVLDGSGRPSVLDHFGRIRTGAFQQRRSIHSDITVVGLAGVANRQSDHRRGLGHSPPPSRRYFRRGKFGRGSAPQVEDEADDTYWELDVSAALAAESDEPQNLSKDAAKEEVRTALFIPTPALAGRAPQQAAPRRREELEAQLRSIPANTPAWLELAELQWQAHHEKGVARKLSVKEVRERQLQVLDAALEACPGDVELLRTYSRIEGDSALALDAATLQERRKSRLLRCGQAHAAEELVWAYLDAASRSQQAEAGGAVGAVERAAVEVLGILATRKTLAAHDGRACAALERAQLAVTSSIAFVWSLSGHHARACELLRASATLATWFPEAQPEALSAPWRHGCRMGKPTLLRGLSEVMALTEVEKMLGDMKGTLPALLEASACMEDTPPGLRAEHDLANQAGAAPPRDADRLVGLADLAPGPTSEKQQPRRSRERCRMRSWVASELACGLREDLEIAEAVSLDELRPFLSQLRLLPSRREAVLRFLDLLGASSSLSRHSPQSRYRQAFAELGMDLSMASPGSHLQPTSNGAKPKVGERGDGLALANARRKLHPLGGCSVAGWRPSWLAPGRSRDGMTKEDYEALRALCQSLLVWPRDATLSTLLVDGLSVKQGKLAHSLCRTLLHSSEDAHLFFRYGRGLWLRGERNAARQLFLKLCKAASPPDIRLAMAWWHLEHRGCMEDTLIGGSSSTQQQQASDQASRCEQPRRPLHLLVSLVTGEVDSRCLSDEHVAGTGLELKCLQASVRLCKSLPARSCSDCRTPSLGSLLSSFHAALVGACVLMLPFSSVQHTWDTFKGQQMEAQLKIAAGTASQAAGGGEEKQQEDGFQQSSSLACMLMVELLAACPRTSPRLTYQAIKFALRLHPANPWLLMVLAEWHRRRGTLEHMRLDIDRALSLHRLPLLGGGPSQASSLCLRAALQAELMMSSSMAPHMTVRATQLCERWHEVYGRTCPFVGTVEWVFHQWALALQEGSSSVHDELRWRTAVRAVEVQPIAKTLWLLHLAAFEGRLHGSKAEVVPEQKGNTVEEEEELLLDLVSAMEARRIALPRDPLQALA